MMPMRHFSVSQSPERRLHWISHMRMELRQEGTGGSTQHHCELLQEREDSVRAGLFMTTDGGGSSLPVGLSQRSIECARVLLVLNLD